VTPLFKTERDAKAGASFNCLPIQVSHKGDRAYCRPNSDSAPRNSAQVNSYYAARGRESVHSTGAKHRLQRDLTGRFGSEPHAVEELVAGRGAAFLCADLGVSQEPRLDHDGYIESRLKVLKRDTHAIFTAAGKAQAAVDWPQAQQRAAL
jgi:antirestriction protein ArdC